MRRRDFLKGVLATGAAMQLPSLRAFGGEASDDKIIMCAPLTHSDWMLKPGIEFGESGVRHMLDMCKAAGWSRVMWRAFDAGQATYKSKLVDPACHWDPNDNFFHPRKEDEKEVAKYTVGLTPERKKEILDKFAIIDYGKFDSLGYAVEYAHKIGLQLHAWVSINEDDHGWGMRSRFSKEHPQFRWVRRDGRPYKSQMSFAFPEVRDYKLAIVKELTDGYAIDGLFVDWIRTGDVRDNPQTDPNGVANSGYETPNIQAFKSKFNKDPHDVPNEDPDWVAVRAEPQTLFMRELRKSTKLPICAMVAHPWAYRGFLDKVNGSLKGLLLDVPTWAKEKLVDAFIPEGYYRDGGTPEMAYNALKKEVGEVPLGFYAWVPQNVGEFDRDYALAKKLGAPQMLFWEADYIDDRAAAAELKKAMSAKSA
jgi:hypothetical protein